MRAGVSNKLPSTRLVFLACAAAFCHRPTDTARLTHIARLAGLPAAAVWEVIARHALLDCSHDSWVEFTFKERAWAPAEGTDEEVPLPPEGAIGV